MNIACLFLIIWLGGSWTINLVDRNPKLRIAELLPGTLKMVKSLA